MTAFYVGQEVVCVDDGPTPKQRLRQGKKYGAWDYPLMSGAHYVIRWVGASWDGHQSVRVEGVTRNFGDGDSPLWAGRFRPIDQSKIAIFRQMCVSTKPLVPVE